LAKEWKKKFWPNEALKKETFLRFFFRSLQELLKTAKATKPLDFVLSSMKKGESILIHAGSGGRSSRCVPSRHRRLLDSRHSREEGLPILTEENIGNSRNTSFEKMIQVNTKSKESITSSTRFLSPYDTTAPTQS
jgi:hypothetical protein